MHHLAYCVQLVNVDAESKSQKENNNYLVVSCRVTCSQCFPIVGVQKTLRNNCYITDNQLYIFERYR